MRRGSNYILRNRFCFFEQNEKNVFSNFQFFLNKFLVQFQHTHFNPKSTKKRSTLKTALDSSRRMQTSRTQNTESRPDSGPTSKASTANTVVGNLNLNDSNNSDNNGRTNISSYTNNTAKTHRPVSSSIGVSSARTEYIYNN